MGSPVKDGEQEGETSRTGQRPNKVHMNVGEPPCRNRNLRYSRMNMLVNFTLLTFNAGSGLGGDVLREASPDKKPQNHPPVRTITRVGEVVESIKILWQS